MAFTAQQIRTLSLSRLREMQVSTMTQATKDAEEILREANTVIDDLRAIERDVREVLGQEADWHLARMANSRLSYLNALDVDNTEGGNGGEVVDSYTQFTKAAQEWRLFCYKNDIREDTAEELQRSALDLATRMAYRDSQ